MTRAKALLRPDQAQEETGPVISMTNSNQHKSKPELALSSYDRQVENRLTHQIAEATTSELFKPTDELVLQEDSSFVISSSRDSQREISVNEGGCINMIEEDEASEEEIQSDSVENSIRHSERDLSSSEELTSSSESLSMNPEKEKDHDRILELGVLKSCKRELIQKKKEKIQSLRLKLIKVKEEIAQMSEKAKSLKNRL